MARWRCGRNRLTRTTPNQKKQTKQHKATSLMNYRKTFLSLTLLACIAGAQPLRAGTHVWSGTQDSFWGNPANWSSGGAPSAYEAAPVIIQFPSTASARRE